MPCILWSLCGVKTHASAAAKQRDARRQNSFQRLFILNSSLFWQLRSLNRALNRGMHLRWLRSSPRVRIYCVVILSSTNRLAFSQSHSSAAWLACFWRVSSSFRSSLICRFVTRCWNSSFYLRVSIRFPQLCSIDSTNKCARNHLKHIKYIFFFQ